MRPKRSHKSRQKGGKREESHRKGKPRASFGGNKAKGKDRDNYRDKGRGKVRARAIQAKATVDKNRKGFAFLIFENKDIEDAFIPPEEAKWLFPGDRVEATIDSRGKVQQFRVLEHRFREVVGRFTPHPKNGFYEGWVTYERKRTREEIYVPRNVRPVKPGDWVRAKLHFHEKGPFPITAEILAVYGKELPASADVSMIAAEYNLIEEHPHAAEQEAIRLKLETSGKAIQHREDLREVPFITIDGEHARDFDDAIFVERKKSGYILWVAIADVSHYVKEGSHLDQDARSRGTSVYFPERAFHMLPRHLSENLCSLKPLEPRFSLVAQMEFDRNGTRLSTQVMEAIIESKRRATYEEIQSEWEKNGKNSQWEYTPHFELYRILKKVRSERGSIDFELPEAEVAVKPTGEVLSIKNRARLDSHRLIEEFMIVANESVTEWMMTRKWPFIYRVHEEPSWKSLEKFQSLAATVGIQISVDEAQSPKVVSGVVKKLEGHPAQLLLNMALLRSMKQAIYSASHGIHYGLASKAYTHFTSPIRRYPDLVVHRLIRMALQMESKRLRPFTPSSRKKLEDELAQICEHCSYRERLAADADREAIKLKQVRLMASCLGAEMESKIVGMVASGLFVQLNDPYVEGMIPLESLSDDFYEFNEERMIVSGRRKRRTFKIGDSLRVKVVRADMDKRQIDFAMIEK